MWLLPLTTMLLTGLCSGLVLRMWRQSKHPAHLTWSLVLFGIALASACLFLGSLAGWNTMLAKLYYLMAAVVFTGGLSLGTAYLLAPRAIAHFWLATLLVAALVILVLLNSADVDSVELAAGEVAGWRLIDTDGPLPGIAAAMNSIGTLVLVTGAIVALVYKRFALATSLVAFGALVLYYGGNILGTASTWELASVAQLAGVLISTTGIMLTRKVPSRWD